MISYQQVNFFDILLIHHIARIDPSDFFYRAFLTYYISSSSSFLAAFGKKLAQFNSEDLQYTCTIDFQR